MIDWLYTFLIVFFLYIYIFVYFFMIHLLMFSVSLQFKGIEDNFLPLLYFEEHHVNIDLWCESRPVLVFTLTFTHKHIPICVSQRHFLHFTFSYYLCWNYALFTEDKWYRNMQHDQCVWNPLWYMLHSERWMWWWLSNEHIYPLCLIWQ